MFVQPAGGWVTSSVFDAKLTASDGAANDLFGWSVAVDADTIVASALADQHGAVNQGSAYVFVRPLSGWAGFQTENAKLTASDAGAGDFFNESEAAYVFNLNTLTGLSLDMDGSATTRYSPFFKIRQWRSFGVPPTITVEGVTKTGDVETAMEMSE